MGGAGLTAPPPPQTPQLQNSHHKVRDAHVRRDAQTKFLYYLLNCMFFLAFK